MGEAVLAICRELEADGTGSAGSAESAEAEMTQLRRQFMGTDAERPKAPLFYSVAEVAEMFGMSPMTVYRAIAANEFPAVRVRGRLVIPARVLDAIVDAAFDEHGTVDVASFAAHKPADSGA